ncbi:MAG: Uma2 family endonuclease [Spirulina sp.]
MTIAQPPIFYPESDGKPLADNTVQFRLIVTIQGGLDTLYKDDANVFVAGDLFWYPVEGQPTIVQAPDVMVAWGRPKGDRRSYKQWEEGNIAPQVVFEIVSQSNSVRKLEGEIREFYEDYGVEEYYLYDPIRRTLKGWLRSGRRLEPISSMAGWISPRLRIRFEFVNRELQLYRPDGVRFVSFVEVMEQKEQERERAERAERERAEERQARQQAEQARQQAEQARREAIPRLLAMGLTVEQVAEALSLSVEMVREFE